jgi:ATP-dependent helicase/nuclease subunit B
MELAPPPPTASLFSARYGRDALLALRAKIADAKAGDPLAPVTVLVPTNVAGLHVRRALVGAAAGDGPGLAAVRFSTLRALATLLAEERIPEGRLPATPILSRLAAGRAIREAGDRFRPFADAPTAVQGIERTLADLRRSPTAAIERLEHTHPELARIYGAWRETLAAFFDGEDLLDWALDAVREEAPILREAGQCILYLPEPAGFRERRLLRALRDADRLDAVFGRTGTESDDELRAFACDLGFDLPESAEAAEPQTACAVLADAREEARFAVSEAVRLASAPDGPKLSRIALLSMRDAPYDALIEGACREAGVPVHGRGLRQLAGTPTGRALSGFLRLRNGEFRRHEVMDWLCSAPVQARDGWIPAERWDRISRTAKITRGLSAWTARLERYAGSVRRDADRRKDGPETGWREDEAREAERMLLFLRDLQAALRPPSDSSWSGWVAWALAALDRYLDAEKLDDDAQNQDRLIREGLEELRVADRVEPGADGEGFAAAVAEILSAQIPQASRYGSGLYRGRLSDAMALDFDHVFLLGMHEGAFPLPPATDPVLPDEERGDDVPPRGVDEAAQRRRFEAARCLAPHMTFLTGRVDWEKGRELLPCAWFLEEAGRLHGAPVYSADLLELREETWLTMPASPVEAIATRPPQCARDYELRSLLACGDDLDGHPLCADAAFAAGVDFQREVLGDRFGACDGHVGPTDWLHAERRIRVTTLEVAATCPRHFFFREVLRVRETEAPRDVDTLERNVRGSLVHAVLQRYVELKIAEGYAEEPAEDEALMRRLADEELDRAEREELIGLSILWRKERERLRQAMVDFVEADREFRERHGSAPLAVEFSFGREEPHLEPIGDHHVWLSGMVDRIDRIDDGCLVIDYKTGRDRYSAMERDPLMGGKLLQLPLYGRVAGRLMDLPYEGSGFYWVLDKGRWRARKQELGEDEMKAFEQNLAALLDAIRDGVFPGRPGKLDNERNEHCRYCAYHDVCPTDRLRIWERKRTDPLLEDLAALELRATKLKGGEGGA